MLLLQLSRHITSWWVWVEQHTKWFFVYYEHCFQLAIAFVLETFCLRVLNTIFCMCCSTQTRHEVMCRDNCSGSTNLHNYRPWTEHKIWASLYSQLQNFFDHVRIHQPKWNNYIELLNIWKIEYRIYKKIVGVFFFLSRIALELEFFSIRQAQVTSEEKLFLKTEHELFLQTQHTLKQISTRYV